MRCILLQFIRGAQCSAEHRELHRTAILTRLHIGLKNAIQWALNLHAWINPYRVTKGKDAEFAALSPQNPAVLHPEWVVKHSDGNYYLNPGIAEVRALVTDGVREIIDNYNVDGIHMGTIYFYPGSEFEDAAHICRVRKRIYRHRRLAQKQRKFACKMNL